MRLAALVALALLFVAGGPHFHEEPEGQVETCVLCHGLDATPAASAHAEGPHPVAAPISPPAALERPAEAPRFGPGPRAPPA